MRIGYLGVGNMGLPMASRLIDAGHEVWVYDLRDEAVKPLLERQARRATSPKDLADACKTVVVSLPTSEIFRSVLAGDDGLLAGSSLKTFVNTCTVGAPFINRVAAQCSEYGIAVIDAPISGGASGAKAGTLAIMISGDAQKVSELMPVFKSWGTSIVVAGIAPGVAQTMKLVNNVLYAVSIVATSEAMTMAQMAGVPPGPMLEVLNNGTGRNFATMHLFPEAIIPRTFETGATVAILMKDVDLAVSQGEELGIPMWVCHAARLVMKHGVFQGRAQQDLSRVVQIVEDGTRKP